MEVDFDICVWEIHIACLRIRVLLINVEVLADHVAEACDVNALAHTACRPPINSISCRASVPQQVLTRQLFR
jgi:hypothetical protein